MSDVTAWGCGWDCGYFCAVAKMLEHEGQVTPVIQELFTAGGDWSRADECDLAVFRDHGLIP